MSLTEDNAVALPTAPIRLINKLNKCKCMCIRRPNWYINPVSGLYPIDQEKVQTIPLKSSHLEAKVVNSIAKIKYSQVFHNEESAPLEVVYKFPADPYFSVTGMHIKLDDKEIDAVIMKKEEAKEKYDDAVAAGNTAAKINYDENIPEILELAVGALQPDKTVTIDVEMVAKCDVIQHGFFSLIFPINFIPKYTPKGTESVPQPKAGGKYLHGKFSADISVEANNTISDLSVSHMMEYNQEDNGRKITVRLPEAENVVAKDIVVSFSTEDIREPCVTLHGSSKHPEEVAAHISYIPRVSDEHEVDEDSEEAKDTDESPEVVTEVDDHDDPDIASGDFIFILDRSGSMGGSRIRTAREALKLFIQSLPPKSKFNIIGFGTRLDFFKRGCIENTKENVQEALDAIEGMKSDLGGTKLLEHLNSAYKFPIESSLPRSIFILTDGAISNTEQVVNRVREMNYSARVHSYGIGSGASKYLVKELAKAGLGSSALIPDDDPKMKGKVIQALKLASKPAFTDIKVDWKDNEGAIEFQVPRPPVTGNVYEEEAFNLYAILKKSDLAKGEIELSFYNTFNENRDTITLQVDPEQIVDNGEDDFAFKLAAKENMIHLKRSEDEQDVKSRGQALVDLSLKYSVLSEKTAFFGKIKNKEKSGEEMKTIEIPIKKVSAPHSFGRMPKSLQKCAFVGDACGGARLMKCRAAAPMKNAKKRSKRPSGMAAPPPPPGMAAPPAPPAPPSMAAPQMACAPSLAAPPAPQARARRAMDVGQRCGGLFDEDEDDSDELAFTAIESKTSSKRSKKGKKDEKESKRKSSGSTSASAGYDSLIAFQEDDGHFSKLPAEYKALGDKTPPANLEAAVKDSSKLAEIWITIIAVLVLERDFKDSKDEWTMIAKKAKAFLKKNLEKGTDINQFKSELA